MFRLCNIDCDALKQNPPPQAGLEKRFPWLNTNGLGGGCLGLESEGWFDPWNLLQALQLRNKHLGERTFGGCSELL